MMEAEWQFPHYKVGKQAVDKSDTIMFILF